MENSTPKTSIIPSAAALLPLITFLCIFLGGGIYYQMQGTDYAFYQISSPIAILPAILLAVILSRKKLNSTIEQFLKGAGDSNIMAMCMIYLLAGGFSAVAKATGGVDATVNLALSVIPDFFLLPGLFLVSAFISTAMGTSMGTIAAVSPIALGIAQSAGISLPVIAGAVLSGAMFGDNLSIISDTTIAATRSQGCEMRDKFKVNVFIATPAALITIFILLTLDSGNAVANIKEVPMLAVIPYVAILVLALSGVNVFVVLFTGIILAGGIGMNLVDSYSISSYAKDIYSGFSNMQEIFILSIMIGGLSALMKEQGGLAFVSNQIEKLISRFSKKSSSSAPAELGLAAMVALTNACTANNTVSIIVTGSVANDISKKNNVIPKRSASILDIFSCVCQGLIPYGAQTLLVASILGISPLTVMSHSYYCMLLAVTALIDIFIFNKKRVKNQVAQVA